MKTIHHVIDLDADSLAVWAALTEPDRMAGWWSTKVEAPPQAIGTRTVWTFGGDFNPVMETVALDPPNELVWRCVAGHDPWQDSTFRFRVAATGEHQSRLRFWQEYAVELADDYYGVYNFNWGYYLESLRLLCVTDTGKPYQPQRTTN
jgi:uncharacterized protein YndB with AHSA1/START domain